MPVKKGEESVPFVRRLPIGAEVVRGGGVHFRVWAPASKTVTVEIQTSGKQKAARPWRVRLQPEDNRYFAGLVPGACAGMRYRFRLDSGVFPDPASRFQPEGPFGPSEIIDPSTFRWRDQDWKGIGREGQVLYEMHIGTFTRAGTWSAAIEQLPELAQLGITVLEVMPVADFPGRFGWGYDGVNFFAPTRLYGRPDDFRRFVDRAHKLGLGVILDVVYNHFGPDGNFLLSYSKDYVTDRYKNEWGEAVNFDGPNSTPVREFVLANAEYWVSEFHLDGLRIDASQQIFDASPDHILAALSRRVRQRAGERQVYLTAENETQHARLAEPSDQGGYALDSLWNDDFHHSAMVAAIGRSEAYYSDYLGSPQEFISAAKRGFLYQGQWYHWQNQRRGTSSARLHPNQFITFLQNHDQVANTLKGARISHLCGPGRLRALTALLLLGPGTPMLFQGQEFGASTPFLYFADHKPELAKLVAKGRREFLRQFSTISCPESDPYLADPGSEESFRNSKLDLGERKKHANIYQLHQDLIALRRGDPVFGLPQPGGMDGAVLGPEAFVFRFFGGKHGDRLLLVNLGTDLHLQPIPEPLLAAPAGEDWSLVWSSESPQYDGCGTPPWDSKGKGRLLGHAAVVLKAPENGGNQA